MAQRWVYSLEGKEVVFMGHNPGYEEAELEQLCRDHGARRVMPDCNLTTNILMRGHSSRWKYGQYGKKEAKAARMQADGHDIAIIDLHECWAWSKECPRRHCPRMCPTHRRERMWPREA